MISQKNQGFYTVDQDNVNNCAKHAYFDKCKYYNLNRLYNTGTGKKKKD